MNKLLYEPNTTLNDINDNISVCVCDGCGKWFSTTSLCVLRPENSPINFEYCGNIKCKIIIDELIKIAKLYDIIIDLRPRIKRDPLMFMIPEQLIIDTLLKTIIKYNVKYNEMLSLGRIEWLLALSLIFTQKKYNKL